MSTPDALPPADLGDFNMPSVATIEQAAAPAPAPARRGLGGSARNLGRPTAAAPPVVVVPTAPVAVDPRIEDPLQATEAASDQADADALPGQRGPEVDPVAALPSIPRFVRPQPDDRPNLLHITDGKQLREETIRTASTDPEAKWLWPGDDGHPLNGTVSTTGFEIPSEHKERLEADATRASRRSADRIIPTDVLWSMLYEYGEKKNENGDKRVLKAIAAAYKDRAAPKLEGLERRAGKRKSKRGSTERLQVRPTEGQRRDMIYAAARLGLDGETDMVRMLLAHRYPPSPPRTAKKA